MSQNEMNYKEEEKLLGRCRDASTRQEQLEAWKNLIAFVKKDNTSHAAKENIARSVLLEWPYSGQVDDLIDACGIVIAVSICTRIFKEWTTVASRTKLPLPSLMEACWTTLQRLALSPINNEKSQQQACYVFVVERIDMLPFVQTLLLLPQIISNACHSQKVRIPWMATPANFYPRLVDCSCQRVVQSSSLENRNHSSTTLLYMETLIKAMLTSRKSEFVAMGLANHHPLSYLSKMDLSPRETSNFLISMLQNCLAHHNDDDKAVLDTCLQILKSCSIDHQEAFVQHVVLSSPKELRLCPLIIHLLDQSGCLYSSLCTISETWSQWTFCHEMDSHQQHYVTQVLLRGLSQLKEEDPTTTDSDDLTLCLLQGVTHRLESSFPQTRRDGMKIAQQVAKRLGQELHFDELLEQQHQKEVDTTVGFLQAAKTSATKSRPTKKKHKVKPRQLDPDADYDSDEDELGASVCSTDDSEQSSRDDDSINVWENDFAPYDLDDAEDDLVETRNPLHLLEALELLRTSENDDHAYSNHETALRCLPDLIQKRPDDLPDVAVSLVLQFLRMENKFNITGFAEMRHQGILQLTIQEPLSVGQHMIEALFRDGSLSDRVNILVALQEAAYELSGSKQIDDREKEKTKKTLEPARSSSAPVSKIDRKSEQIVRIQAKTRQKRTRTSAMIITNQFTSIAPLWFYSLISNFMKQKDNEALWTGSTGSQFLANLFRTLAIIVEFSGIHCSQVLANDLLEVVWSFRTADVAEVRLSVLVSVATSIALLPEDRVFSLLLLKDNDSLPQTLSDISRTDPDNNCRSLATSISRSIVDALESVDDPQMYGLQPALL